MLYVAGLDNIEKKDQLNGIIKINYYKNNYFLDLKLKFIINTISKDGNTKYELIFFDNNDKIIWNILNFSAEWIDNNLQFRKKLVEIFNSKDFLEILKLVWIEPKEIDSIEVNAI